MDKIKAFLTPKVLAAIFVLISSLLGLNEVSNNYTIEPKPEPVEVKVTMPQITEDKISEICNKISAKRDDYHLEEYHGGH
jgi:hypothetical protein